MNFLVVKSKEYFKISVVNFNNWNRVFQRCMHILHTDFDMPRCENLVLTLHSFLKIIYPSDSINSISQLSEKDELELADKFLSSCLTFLLDINN